MSAAPQPRMTVEEYLAWDLAHEGKHEFVNGEVWAMAGAHIVHNLLANNLAGMLYQRLRGTPCRGLSSDTRVLIDETGLYCYPDLTVVCGPPETVPTNPPTLVNPRLVVEVLSPSTALFDKDIKFAHYRRRASIEGVLLVSWPERRLELYTRGPDGWLLTEARGSESLAVKLFGFDLPLDEVYDGMDEALAAEAARAEA